MLKAKKLLDFIFIFLLITLSWKSFWAMLNIFIPIIKLPQSLGYLLCLTILVVVYVFLYSRTEPLGNTYQLLGLILLVFILLTLFFFNDLVNSEFPGTTIGNDISTYAWIFILIFVLAFKLRINESTFEKTALLLILPQLLLAIVQHLKNKPIVPLSVNGGPLVTTVFSLNGVSTSNSDILLQGGVVRGFGMTINALTLGVMALVVFSISLNSKMLSRKTKFVFLMISVAAIYSTMTRNVYIGAILILVFSLLNLRPPFYKLLFFLTNIFSILGIYFGKLLDYINQIATGNGISTFAIRYISLFVHLKSLDTIPKILFGAQIKSTPRTPLDNGPIAMLVDKGLLFTIIVLILLVLSFNYVVNRMNSLTRPLVIFILVFPIMNFANALTDVFGTFLIFLVMVSSQNESEQGSLVSSA